MKRKATARGASLKNAAGSAAIKEDQALRQTKQTGSPSNAPVGRGLGKAGAKRLGRLLKRVIQHHEDEPPGKREVSLPKTPVRLLKHQIQSEASNAPEKNSSKMASPQVSKLILSVVSQCKQKDGISMAELKETLAAEGYNVTKNNRQVKVVTKRLVDSETLVRTTRNASFRITSERLLRTTRQSSIRLKKKLTETRKVNTNPVKFAKPKGELKQNTTAHKSPKRQEQPRRQTKKTRGKSHIPKGKTQTAAKSHQQAGKHRKPAAKSHLQRTPATKSRRKQQKPCGKKRRTAKKQTIKPRRPQRKAKRI